MPRKISKRKAIQAAKRQAAADAESRKNRKWPGTRRTAMIAHAHTNMHVLGSLLIAARAVPVVLKGYEK